MRAHNTRSQFENLANQQLDKGRRASTGARKGGSHLSRKRKEKRAIAKKRSIKNEIKGCKTEKNRKTEKGRKTSFLQRREGLSRRIQNMRVKKNLISR